MGHPREAGFGDGSASANVTSLDYNHDGCLLSITDPSSNQTTFTCTPTGQTATSTYAGTGGNRTTTYSYFRGDLVSVTDPLGRVTSSFVDGGGRLLSGTIRSAIAPGTPTTTWAT